MSSASRTHSSLTRINACVKASKLLNSPPSKLLIIHHWDADGVASAAAVARIAGTGNVFTEVPRIGVYGAEALTRIKLREDSLTLILDYGVNPAEVIKALGSSDYLIIDHHAVSPNPKVSCNPVAEGLCGEVECPATAKLILDLTGDEGLRELAVLGVVGDLGPKAPEALRMAGLTLMINDLRRFEEASQIIDACYKMLKPELIRHAVNVLANEGVEGILRDEALISNHVKLKEIAGEALSKVKEVLTEGPVKVYDLRINSYLTSHIGRLLAREHPKEVIVLRHEIPELSLTYVYVRSYSINLRDLGIRLKVSGHRVGGKDYVIVATCLSRECVNSVTEEVVKYFMR